MDTTNVMGSAQVKGDIQTLSPYVASQFQAIVSSQSGSAKVSFITKGAGFYRIEYKYLMGWGKGAIIAGVVLLLLITLITQSYISWYTSISTFAYSASEQMMIGVGRLMAFLAGTVVPAILIAVGAFFGRKTEVCTVTVTQVKEGLCKVSAIGPTENQVALAIQTFINNLQEVDV